MFRQLFSLTTGDILIGLLEDKDYILKVDKLTVSFDRWIYLPVKTAVNI